MLGEIDDGKLGRNDFSPSICPSQNQPPTFDGHLFRASIVAALLVASTMYMLHHTTRATSARVPN